MPYRPSHIAFTGPRPDVKAGDPVECRDAGGVWRRMIARSEPRYDEVNALGGKCYLTVAVAAVPGRDPWVNWPAEDVRPIAEPTSPVDMLEVDRGE